MRYKIKKVKSNEIFYLFSIFILAVIYGLSCSQFVKIHINIKTLLNNIEWLLYLMLFVQVIFLNKYSKKQLVILAFSGLFLTVGYIISGYAALLRTFLVVVASKKVNYRRIFMTIFYAVVFSFICVFLLYFLKISDAGVLRRGYKAFGFSQTNVCCYIIQTACFTWFAAHDNLKLTKEKTMILWSIAFLNYKLLGGRNTSIILFLFPIVTAVIETIVKRKKYKYIKQCICLFPVLCHGITMATTMLYEKNKLVQRINDMIGSRIFLNYFNFYEYGLSLFGKQTIFNDGKTLYNKVTNKYSTYNTIDNSYMCLTLQMGVIGTIIWLATFFITIAKMVKNEKTILISITLLLCIFGLFESSIIEIIIGFPLIFLFADDS